jgi:Flp pilus assembly pilin Flp
MTAFTNRLRSFRRGRSGVSGLGYAITVGLVAVVALAATASIGSSVSDVIGGAGKAIEEAGGTPHPFALSPRMDQPLSMRVESDSVVLAGMVRPAMASVDGEGEPAISTDGGETWGPMAVVESGTEVMISLISADAPATTRTAMLSIGSFSTAFEVTTAP